MAEIVHITFEKLTGLKGTIEGDFNVDRPDLVNQELPIIFIGLYKKSFCFRQGPFKIYMDPVDKGVSVLANYFSHFRYGVNFLIKEWSDGANLRSKSPN